MPPPLSIELPSFDTGQYEGCELHMANGDATLTINVSELPSIIIGFYRVRWHRFTAIYACEPDWFSESYFRVSAVKDSPILAAFLKADQATLKAYKELHHFRIVLDETGCHEVLAESARLL